METGVAAPGGKPGLVTRVLSSAPARKLLALHEAHPRRAAAGFFLAGVGWDAATIFRIDSVIDNAIILTYLFALCVLYVAATLHDAGKLRSPTLLRFVRWYPMASQFLMGALFSMFVFFYSQSASWSETSVFLVILIVLLVANEILHDRMFSVRLRLVLLYFVLASYLVYSVPILVGAMNHFTFTLGLLLAAGIVGLIGRYLWKRDVFSWRQLVWSALALPTMVAFLEVAYVKNWIPPVPMAVREAGVYHTVKRDGEDYRMRLRKPSWYKPFKRSETPFHFQQGDTVFVYAAVFAPTRIQKEIVHRWQRQRADGTWEDTDRIAYLVAGGRDNGYRGYTNKRRVEPGAWRVRVETNTGRLLTRIRFDVVPAEEPITRWKWISD